MAIKENQVVSVSYELKDIASGEVIDSNLEAAPLTFIAGKGQIIPGLESEIVKLSHGDSDDIVVSAKDGYGEYDDAKIETLPREQFAGLEMSEGMTLYGQGEDGGTVQVIVKNFNNETVDVDFNHPLAGKDLLFAINIVEVREATEDELLNGFVGSSGGCGCGTGDSCHTTEEKKEQEQEHECCGGSGGCGTH